MYTCYRRRREGCCFYTMKLWNDAEDSSSIRQLKWNARSENTNSRWVKYCTVLLILCITA